MPEPLYPRDKMPVLPRGSLAYRVCKTAVEDEDNGKKVQTFRNLWIDALVRLPLRRRIEELKQACLDVMDIVEQQDPWDALANAAHLVLEVGLKRAEDK